MQNYQACKEFKCVYIIVDKKIAILYLQNSASFSNFSVLSGLLSSAIIDLILQYNLKIRERNLAQKTNSGWNPGKDKENKTILIYQGTRI